MSPGNGDTALLAVSAVLPVRYQPADTRFRQKSWARAAAVIIEQ
jgi:hypothetical protein